jgi:hypothetical protein
MVIESVVSWAALWVVWKVALKEDIMAALKAAYLGF